MKAINIIKNNWTPKILLGSLITNCGLCYYKYNIDGTSRQGAIAEWCTEQSHIFPCSYNQKGGWSFIVHPIIVTSICGMLSVPLTAYDVYTNHIYNKEFKKSRAGKLSCECGEIKN